MQSLMQVLQPFLLETCTTLTAVQCLPNVTANAELLALLALLALCAVLVVHHDLAAATSLKGSCKM